MLKSGGRGAGGGGGIVLVISITQPIKTGPLLVKTTGHNSPRTAADDSEVDAVSVLSSSFTHSITVGCSRRASAGLLVPARSPDGVGAQPVLLNPFALKPTIEAAEPGVSFSPLREPHSLPRVCLFKEISNKNWGFDTQEPPGTWALHVSCPVTQLVLHHPYSGYSSCSRI